MLSSEHAHRFIAHIDVMDIGLFILILFVISFVVKGIRYFSEWISKKYPSQRMVVFEWVPVLNFLIYFIGGFGAFYSVFEPSRELIIAFIISGFVAIGFAAKDVLTSIISGVILLIDKPFQVGDRVEFQGHYGEILKIGLRSVKLLTLDESLVTIPNNRFINEVVSSSSAGEIGMMTTVDVYVSPHADLYKVKEVLHKESQKSTYINTKGKIVIVGKEVLGVNGTVSFVMTVKCILKDARLEKAFQTEFLMGVNKEFKIQDVKLPG